MFLLASHNLRRSGCDLGRVERSEVDVLAGFYVLFGSGNSLRVGDPESKIIVVLGW